MKSSSSRLVIKRTSYQSSLWESTTFGLCDEVQVSMMQPGDGRADALRLVEAHVGLTETARAVT